MARNDGVNRTIARQGEYTRSSIQNIERHHERKNTNYDNIDVDLNRSNMNIYFKKPTGTYLSMFDDMCEKGIISTRGQREDAIIIDEMLCDVNSSYFENNGGYDFAKEFFKKSYDFAVKEAGGQEYILSAVMHADELNKDLSEKFGKDTYHYHLHVVYVPVVQKEVKWSKRCKDKSLVGTVKEVITQVSHSKKWASHKEVDEDGKSHLIPSYSLLQDRYFEYMKNCGYKDVERGEKGSTDKHKSTIKFKTEKDIERNNEIIAKQENVIVSNENKLEVIATKETKIKEINTIETKPTLLDKSKITVDKSEFENLKNLAQKQIASDKKDSKAIKENKKLKQENKLLKTQNTTQAQELFEFKSVTNQLNAGKEKSKIKELEKLVNLLMKFLDFMKLREKFEQFKQNISKVKEEEIR